MLSLSPFSSNWAVGSPGTWAQTGDGYFRALAQESDISCPRLVCIKILRGFNEKRVYILKVYLRNMARILRNTMIFSEEYPMSSL